jgi:hypothetical protein
MRTEALVPPDPPRNEKVNSSILFGGSTPKGPLTCGDAAERTFVA